MEQLQKELSSVAQSCPTLCDPIDSSPPGSPCLVIKKKNYKADQKAKHGIWRDKASIGNRQGRNAGIICFIKKPMKNMLRVLMDKVENVQEHMGSVSGTMEILRENWKKSARDKTATEMKNAFDGLVIIRLDMAELEDLSIETSKIKTK